MNSKLEKILIEQVQAELDSSYLYLSMAAYLDHSSWPGMASWMYLQVEEEREHGMKIFKFLMDRGVFPKLLALSEPQDTWDGPLAIFEAALAHEKKVTALINGCMDVAMEVNDHAARGMLDWFVTEQVEEEATVSSIVDKMARLSSDAKGMMMIDNELGQRSPQE